MNNLTYLCNITDPLILIYLLHFCRYYHLYLKYYADLSWVCLFGARSVDISFWINVFMQFVS